MILDCGAVQWLGKKPIALTNGKKSKRKPSHCGYMEMVLDFQLILCCCLPLVGASMACKKAKLQAVAWKKAKAMQVSKVAWNKAMSLTLPSTWQAGQRAPLPATPGMNPFPYWLGPSNACGQEFIQIKIGKESQSQVLWQGYRVSPSPKTTSGSMFGTCWGIWNIKLIAWSCPTGAKTTFVGSATATEKKKTKAHLILETSQHGSCMTMVACKKAPLLATHYSHRSLVDPWPTEFALMFYIP